MKLTHLLLFVLAGAVAVNAQTPAKPAATAATKAKTAVIAKPAATAAKAPTATTGEAKLPPGVPPVAGIKKVAFALRYQDIKIGTGPEAEPNKMYKVNYTGWLADGGRKFDSSFDHKMPLTDKDGKPVLDADGKPKLGDPQPFSFPQGFGRVIPGWDQGFNGMKIGGKRRLFIPWQLAYGAKGRPGPDAEHPGMPPKADLIFDVELVDATEMPMPANHPGGMGMQARPASGAPSNANGTASSPGMPVPQPKPAAPAPTAPATPPAQPQPK